MDAGGVEASSRGKLSRELIVGMVVIYKNRAYCSVFACHAGAHNDFT